MKQPKHPTQLVYSLSKLLATKLKLELVRPSFAGAQGQQNVGAQSLQTHSTQISWQFQLHERRVGFFSDYVVIAIEAYSRFTLLLAYTASLPTWQQIEKDFQLLWMEQLALHLGRTNLVYDQGDMDLILTQYKSLAPPQMVRNLDQSISGHITDSKHWIEDYCQQLNIDRFSEKHAWNLQEHINMNKKRAKKAGGGKESFVPLERFLDDSLYRFAKGLCKSAEQGAKTKDFPNPHRRNVSLTVVS
ncbi:hypothetical protein [Agaribacterium haliotis]|uniref:hypothetical protein n=1 Tax=Agaribacterium haliotis TaxID=2013869 RepID=UPI000BB57051|nr:hypothetical protein [Agaribacterium haliotis]